MTRSCQALSLTPAVREWTQHSTQPRVLHVFEPACNLVNEHREVLSIVTPQIGNGPFNLVVEQDIAFPQYLTSDSPVYLVNSRLKIGDLTVNLETAQPWSPRPSWELLHSQRADITNHVTKLPFTNYSIPNHLTIPQSLVSSLFPVLVNADLRSAPKAASKLAGLGSGLTPSGDDILMGALYAVWILHPPEIARALSQVVASAAAPLTTSLSAAWLRAAGRGEAGQPWHEFLEGLQAGNAKQINRAVENILAVGETSGADAFAGFLGVIHTSQGIFG